MSAIECAAECDVRSNGSKAFRTVSFVLGGCLFIAAALKAHGLSKDPFATDSLLSSPRLVVATIELEIVIAVWLLSGWAQRLAWAVTVGFVFLLAAASGWMALNNYPTCGCLGIVKVSPWVMFGLDVLMLGTLLLWRPPRGVPQLPAGSIPRTATGRVGTFAVAGLMVAGAIMVAADPVDALVRLRGESITLSPPVANAGEHPGRQHRVFSVSLRNHASYPIKIVGGTSTCKCDLTRDLPVTIAPGEQQTITIAALYPAKAGPFRQSFVLFTDDTIQPRVIGQVIGRVAESPSP